MERILEMNIEHVIEVLKSFRENLALIMKHCLRNIDVSTALNLALLCGSKVMIFRIGLIRQLNCHKSQIFNFF